MAREKLQRLIASLHEELGSAESVDDESRVMLQQLIHDLQNLAEDEAPSEESQESASGQLENAALKFESDHPKVSMILGEIMDTLGKLGI